MFTLSASWVLAGGIPAALAAAASFGSCSMLQYRATHEVPERPAGQPKLLFDLVHRRDFRLSIVLAMLGFGLQVLALRLAPLILVQPLLVTGVLWYVLLSAHVYHRPADRVIVFGTLLCIAGISTFLVVADPRSPRASVTQDLGRLIPLAIGLGALVAISLLLRFSVPRQLRALPLAFATGICYGATAGLVRSLTNHFEAGLLDVLQQWQTYAIAVLGPVGVLLNQNSFQAGSVGAPALAIVTVVDPLVAIAMGVVWLQEEIHTSTASLIGEALGLAALGGGVTLLARRAPHVTELPPAAPQPRKKDARAHRSPV